MSLRIFVVVKLMTSDNKNRATTKRAGKKKQARKAALLAEIPAANIDLYVKINELVDLLEKNKQIETEEEKRTFNKIVDYLISR